MVIHRPFLVASTSTSAVAEQGSEPEPGIFTQHIEACLSAARACIHAQYESFVHRLYVRTWLVSLSAYYLHPTNPHPTKVVQHNLLPLRNHDPPPPHHLQHHLPTPLPPPRINPDNRRRKIPRHLPLNGQRPRRQTLRRDDPRGPGCSEGRCGTTPSGYESAPSRRSEIAPVLALLYC